MFNQSIRNLINIVKKHSPNMFINSNFELIVEPKNNIYILLENISSDEKEADLQIKCKMLSWLSRPSCKGLTTKYMKIIRNIFNEVLGTNFNQEEANIIYTYLGNRHDMTQAINFINSGYDLTTLKKENS